MMKYFIAMTFFLVSFSGCFYNQPKIHSPLHALSVKESKSKNIFSHKYGAANIIVNDSINLKVTESWCEKSFCYDDFDKKGKPIPEKLKIRPYHIVIVLQSNLRLTYPSFLKKWKFEDLSFYKRDDLTYLVSNKGSLISNSPLSDTIEIKLTYSIPSDNPNEFNKIKPLGSFFLYKLE